MNLEVIFMCRSHSRGTLNHPPIKKFLRVQGTARGPGQETAVRGKLASHRYYAKTIEVSTDESIDQRSLFYPHPIIASSSL